MADKRGSALCISQNIGKTEVNTPGGRMGLKAKFKNPKMLMPVEESKAAMKSAIKSIRETLDKLYSFRSSIPRAKHATQSIHLTRSQTL